MLCCQTHMQIQRRKKSVPTNIGVSAVGVWQDEDENSRNLLTVAWGVQATVAEGSQTCEEQVVFVSLPPRLSLGLAPIPPSRCLPCGGGRNRRQRLCPHLREEGDTYRPAMIFFFLISLAAPFPGMIIPARVGVNVKTLIVMFLTSLQQTVKSST
jgi:hypothetical protein